MAYTYGEILDLLDECSKWTEINGIRINGNPILERERAGYVKSLEDMLVRGMGTMGVNYIRQYEHLYEGYGRQGDEAYPYPVYHNALLEYLPSCYLFDEMNGQFDDDFKRFACDIKDFTNLSDEDIEKTLAGFASNTFNNFDEGGGIDLLRKVETQAGDRFDKILVGGIPTPWMGGRTPERLDVHGDTLYFFGEETESNTKFLEDLLEGTGYGEFDYYPDGFYRVWWD